MNTYHAEAKKLGYTGTPEKLEHIGMAIERGYVAWSWYKEGDKYGVAGIFEYNDLEPSEELTVEAYADGAANDWRG